MKFINVRDVAASHNVWINLELVIMITPKNTPKNDGLHYEVIFHRYDVVIGQDDYERIVKALQSWE